jgi:hypothetical protein
LDQLDAYACSTQYNDRRYDWDGRLRAAVGDIDVDPGWYVPLKKRKPSTMIQLPKLITKRLSAMTLGDEQWPEINADGDVEAEDYVKTLAEVANAQGKVQEALERGLACGTAVASFAFIDGKPRITVHRAKHIWPLRWADRDEHVLGGALKVYRYKVLGIEAGKPKELTFYHARFWDEQTETVWDPIPEALARDGTWPERVKSISVVHGYGFAPIFWTQNMPDSDAEDGLSAYDGSLDTFDAMNTLISATSKGTIANVDPTLVIKDDPGSNTGALRKGSENAIYSKGGADYLEIKGTAVATAMDLLGKTIQTALDVAGVVLGDPNKMGSQAQSAAAMRIIYLPMVDTCNVLRTQYGVRFLVPLLTGLLKAAKKIGSAAPGPVLTTADGRRIQEKPTVILPPKVVTERTSGEAPARIDPEDPTPPTPPKPGEVTKKTVPRTPGTSENITLKWPPYFRPTASDVASMVTATTQAKGQLISEETAVRATAQMFDVKDVAEELTNIQTEKAVNALMYPGPEMMLPGGMSGGKGGKPDPSGDEED